MEEKSYKKIDIGLISGFLKEKTINSKKSRIISEWFSDFWTNEELRKYSFDRWNNTPGNENLQGYDSGRIQDRIHHIIRLEDEAALEKHKTRTRLVSFLTRAAAILFIPLLTYVLFSLNKLNWAGERSSIAEIHCPLGSRTNFVLPDGTTGWLNAGSYLKFPTSFRGKERTVKLIGEAYFKVHKNPAQVFEVKTKESCIKAYGTSFNVMAYNDEPDIEITLESGSIEVFRTVKYGREESLGKMLPGQMGALVKGTSIFRIKNVDTEQYTSWNQGKLIFRNVPMAEVVRELNRWYNVNIIISDDRLGDYVYRATFVDEKLDEILKIFKKTSPIEYKDLGKKQLPDGTYDKRIIMLYYKGPTD